MVARGGKMGKRTYEAGYAAKVEICSALKGLMAHKPLNKITVAEVMKRRQKKKKMEKQLLIFGVMKINRG